MTPEEKARLPLQQLSLIDIPKLLIHSIRQTVCDTTGLTEEQDKLRSEMEIVVELTQNCVAENARTAQNQEKYQKRYEGLVPHFPNRF